MTQQHVSLKGPFKLFEVEFKKIICPTNLADKEKKCLVD